MQNPHYIKDDRLFNFPSFDANSSVHFYKGSSQIMKNSIVMVFVSLTAYVLLANAQMSTPWTNPYFYYHYNAPLPPQKTSTDEMDGNNKHLSGYDDQIVSDSLGAHSLLMSTCVSELRTTQADLAEARTVIDSMKGKLDNVIATVATLMSKVDNLSATTSIGRMPRSCDDLQRIGHRRSGLFSVMGNKTVDNVYCDFTKPNNAADFQKTIGYFDVKTSPVYFHAQRAINHATANTTLPFEILRLNLGGGMNTSGIFVAPKSAKYFFTCSGMSNVNSSVRVEMQVKTDTVDWTRITQGNGAGNYQGYSIQATMELAKGNQIRIFLVEGVAHDNEFRYTSFVGQLIEEEIVE